MSAAAITRHPGVPLDPFAGDAKILFPDWALWVSVTVPETVIAPDEVMSAMATSTDVTDPDPAPTDPPLLPKG
jgi:hypothetical protein